MAVFYQTYRPLKFADVVGQEAIVRVLLNAAKHQQLAHAYLFTGSRGVGKTTLARIVAKSANCPKAKNGEPCGKCDICTAITAGSFLDVVEIDAASHTGVDHVRELIEHTQFKPSRGAMKVFIIDEVHMLSKAAFNALLKTLEEPPAHAMFILATTDIEKVPETIISRTQRLDFRRISQPEIISRLKSVVKSEHLTLPAGTIELIAENAEGGMRDALSLLGVAASLGEGATLDEVRTLLGVTPLRVVRELIGLISQNQSPSIPDFFTQQEQLGIDFLIFNKGVLECLRGLLVDHIAHPDGHYNDELSAGFSLSQLLFTIRLFLRAHKDIAHSPTAELPVLLAAIEAATGMTATATERPVSPGPVTRSTADVAGSEPSALPKPATSTGRSDRSRTTLTKATDVRTFEEVLPSDLADKVVLEELQQWWPEVIAKVKATNGPLATLLKNSPIESVDRGVIYITVKYLFHKENVENLKNAEFIKDQIQAVSGKRLLVRASINRTTEDSADSVAALGDALKMFGGELVE